MFSKSKQQAEQDGKLTMARGTGLQTPSIIANDVIIEGNVRTDGELQLDGTINGDLSCGNLVMGETGAVNGQILADDLIIRGKVKGEIQARTVRLEKSAIVDGDVYHESLAVESGAQLTGRFSHRQPGEMPGAVGSDDESETPAFLNTPSAAAE